MSLRLRRAAGRIRVLYGATKPLPKPPGKYSRVPTEEEQLRDFDAGRRRFLDRNPRLERAAREAERKVFRKG